MRKFISLRDLPDTKAGTIFTDDGIAYYYISPSRGKVWYGDYIVENNPEWFKEVENKQFTFLTTESFDQCINRFSDYLKSLGILPEKCNDRLYTERQMRECFEDSRLTHPMVGFKYDTYEDYKSKYVATQCSYEGVRVDNLLYSKILK